MALPLASGFPPTVWSVLSSLQTLLLELLVASISFSSAFTVVLHSPSSKQQLDWSFQNANTIMTTPAQTPQRVHITLRTKIKLLDITHQGLCDLTASSSPPVPLHSAHRPQWPSSCSFCSSDVQCYLHWQGFVHASSSVPHVHLFMLMLQLVLL